MKWTKWQMVLAMQFTCLRRLTTDQTARAAMYTVWHIKDRLILLKMTCQSSILISPGSPVGTSRLMHQLRKLQPSIILTAINHRSEHIPRRQPDGSGRDGYIHFSNGGLYNKYKPGNFGNELRGYQVINKPRFGKTGLEFDDYQNWYNQKSAKTKLEQSRLVNR